MNARGPVPAYHDRMKGWFRAASAVAAGSLLAVTGCAGRSDSAAALFQEAWSGYLASRYVHVSGAFQTAQGSRDVDVYLARPDRAYMRGRINGIPVELLDNRGLHLVRGSQYLAAVFGHPVADAIGSNWLAIPNPSPGDVGSLVAPYREWPLVDGFQLASGGSNPARIKAKTTFAGQAAEVVGDRDFEAVISAAPPHRLLQVRGTVQVTRDPIAGAKLVLYTFDGYGVPGPIPDPTDVVDLGTAEGRAQVPPHLVVPSGQPAAPTVSCDAAGCQLGLAVANDAGTRGAVNVNLQVAAPAGQVLAQCSVAGLTPAAGRRVDLACRATSPELIRYLQANGQAQLATRFLVAYPSPAASG